MIIYANLLPAWKSELILGTLATLEPAFRLQSWVYLYYDLFIMIYQSLHCITTK